MWSNKYVGLPYKTHGRDHSGLDCWGLVRLVYQEQYSIILPSFSSEYTENDTARIEELMSQYREGWEPLDSVHEGDLLLFRIMGKESHVGIAISSTDFLHIREGRDSVIDSLNAPIWKNRFVGSFKYTSKTTSQLTALPHPLKTERITVPVPAGTKVGELVEWVQKEYGSKLKEQNICIVLNGKVLSKEDNAIVIQDNDIIEYRAVATGDAGRMLLMIAVVLAAPYMANFLAGGGITTSIFATGGAAGVGAIAAGSVSALTGSMLVAGVQMIGMALVNVIAPIRQPKYTDPGQAEQTYISEGTQNALLKYSSIPFVLGRIRITPPHASNPYGLFASPEENYLKALLCWGYAPLALEETSLRFGQNSFENYSKLTAVHATNYTDVSVWDAATSAVDITYGNDSVQVFSNLALEGGTSVTTNYQTVAAPIIDVGDVGAYSDLNGIPVINGGSNYKVGDVVTAVGGTGAPATFTVVAIDSVYDEYWWTNSNRGVVRTVRLTNPGEYVIQNSIPQTPGATVSVTGGSGTGLVLGPVSYSTKKVVTAAAGMPSTPTSTQIKTVTVTNSYGTLTYTDVLTIAINFPGGCRKINKKTGASAAAPVKFRVEYQETINGVAQGWLPLVIPQDATDTTKPYTDNNGYFTVGSGGPKKNGFTYVLQTPANDRKSSTTNGSVLSVRLGRYTSSEVEDSDYQYAYTSVLQSVTSTINQKPVKDPKNTYIARSAVSVLSTNQLNGRGEAINGIVQTQARIWYNNYWRYPDSVTNNPAALFLHVLTHPAGQFKISWSDALNNGKVDYVALGEWYTFCETNGYAYNSVIAESRSVLEILRDICAAGRASPALVNGRWTVTVDKPQSRVVQLFTPANSWGFEATKVIAKYPHALRVTFNDETRDWQENEIIVYASGYTEDTAELFESISLPGVTNKEQVEDLTRWHIAQARIRNEVITLNADAEYLVCTRGDRVRVQHDIPKWGVGSGRVSDVVVLGAETWITLDTEIVFDASKTYSIIIRNNSTDESTRFNTYTVAAGVDIDGVQISNTGYAIQIVINNASVVASAGFLFAIGEIDKVTRDLVVLSVEPSKNLTARLTLVDYGLLENTDTIIWNEDENGELSIYSNYTTFSQNAVTYNPGITNIALPQKESLYGVIPKIISISTITNYTADGSPSHDLLVNHTLDPTSSYIAVDKVICEFKENLGSLSSTITDYANTSSITIPNVATYSTYYIRIRYVTKEGYLSEWSEETEYSTTNSLIRPAQVSNFEYAVDPTSSRVSLTWNKNPEYNIAYYVVRSEDYGWEDPDSNTYLWKGSATSTAIAIQQNDWVDKVIYIRAYNSLGNFSQESSYIVLRADPLNSVPANTVEYNYGSGTISTGSVSEVITNTSNKINILWSPPEYTAGTNQLPVKSYRVFIHTQAEDMLPVNVLSQYIHVDTETANLGISVDVTWPELYAYLVIYPIDIMGTPGTPIFKTLSRQLPNPVRNLSFQVTDNVVTLAWEAPLTDLNIQLPVQTYLIYESSDPDTELHTDPGVVKIGEKAGLFTTITKLFNGKYKYWVVPVDTNNQQADPDAVALTKTDYREISGPPDYELAADVVSNVSSNGAANAITVVENNISSLLLPVNTTETWQNHFETIGKTSIQQILDSGYVYWLTPSNTVDSVTYTETFTLPNSISSGTISVITDDIALHGSYQINPLIEKLNGTYSSVYDTVGRFDDIQQIRVTLEFIDLVSGNSAPDVLIQFTKMRVLVDSKVINDGGSKSTNGAGFGTLATGTVVTLNKPIPIITAITLTPEYTSTPVIPSYILDTSIKPAVIQNTANSNLVTVTLTSGTFTGIVDSKVYLTIISTNSTARPITSGIVVPVAQVISSTQFVVDMGYASSSYTNTQNVTIVDQFFRVFLRNSNNTLIAADKVGWNVKGYK